MKMKLEVMAYTHSVNPVGNGNIKKTEKNYLIKKFMISKPRKENRLFFKNNDRINFLHNRHVKNRRETDLNFKLGDKKGKEPAMLPNLKKLKKRIQLFLLGCSHSFLKRIENVPTLW